ncbi:hypothetical protein PNA2_1713 [Pyrococcus sp. NA2]|uniref:SufB/SufD family protein n=1 Tax=Pyrococcus sp. (strain NA2) TaxID=342949 RepID=UPI000209AB0B|nr:SufD family Fe-S cluster assembly protein [Pyrococcus sp. NA2]AEC52628.1 hypothetical protein PNA2_1713 [Pyrococcus sp. NA2]
MTIKLVKEYEALLKIYEREGLNKSLFDNRVAAIIISGDRIIGLNNIPGVKIEGKETENGVEAKVIIEDNVELPFPVHLCTGYLKSDGYQRTIFNIIIGKNSKVKFTSHCIFPYAKNFTHEAMSKITVGEGSTVIYEDEHIHGEGVKMISRTEVEVKSGGRYTGKFSLLKHRAREVKLETIVKLSNKAIAELTSKIKAVKDDIVEIREVLWLEGAYSRGEIKSTVVAFDNSKVNVMNEAYGVGDYAKGHIECHEIVKGKADVQTVPLLRVRNEKVELTHEASIGRINEFQLIQLMAKGLSEEEATDFIIKGLLRD